MVAAHMVGPKDGLDMPRPGGQLVYQGALRGITVEVPPAVVL